MVYPTTWIFVADASRARIYAWRDAKIALHPLQEFFHPQSRLANHELVSDRPGRVQQGTPPSRGNSSAGPNKGNRSAMEPPTSPKTVEHEHFAHELAAVLYKGLVTHAYQRLVMVAAPQFLGLLRQVVSDQVTKQVVASLDKDYTSLTTAELEQRLTPLLSGLVAQASAQAG